MPPNPYAVISILSSTTRAQAAVNGRADVLVTFNVRDYGNAASKFGVEVLLPREALARIKQ